MLEPVDPSEDKAPEGVDALCAKFYAHVRARGLDDPSKTRNDRAALCLKIYERFLLITNLVNGDSGLTPDQHRDLVHAEITIMSATDAQLQEMALRLIEVQTQLLKRYQEQLSQEVATLQS